LHTLNLTEGDIRRIFSRIDKDNDGIISYRDYLQWTLELLTFRESNGIPCYFETSTGFESQVIVAPVQVPVEIPVHKPTVVSVRWNFTSRALADAAKQQALRILLGFDANANKIVDSEEIREILRILLKENSLEIDYVLVNFFRYTHGRKSVTFEEFVEFFLGLHCTELTIQRLHREGAFSRGDERIISEAEFIRALVLALSAIKYTASEGDIRQLFRDINTSRNGWISYQSFFEALKEYFGYKLESNLVIYRRTSFINNSTVVAVKQAAPRPVQVVAEPKQEIQDEFGSWIRTITISILSRYDFNKNYEFERDEIIAILRDVFNESPTEIDYVLLNMFRYDTNGDKSVSYDELTNFILEIHCGEIALQRLHKEKKFAQWQKRMLASIDFILSMRTAFAFLKVELKTEDLQRIFAFIDTDRDGLISYGEYFGFIRNYLGSKRKITEPI
jgi:Ca2+-binding EF-hand superfamily protein